MRLCIFFTIFIAKSIQGLWRPKELNYSFQKLFERAVGSDTSVSASVRTHPNYLLRACLIWVTLRCPRVLRKDLLSKPTLYPQSWVFQCLFSEVFSDFFIVLSLPRSSISIIEVTTHMNRDNSPWCKTNLSYFHECKREKCIFSWIVES